MLYLIRNCTFDYCRKKLILQVTIVIAIILIIILMTTTIHQNCRELC